MYIDLSIIYCGLALLGAVVLVYLILTLNNLNKLIKNSSELVAANKKSISDSLEQLPEVVSNLNVVSENVKDITEVATDVTADILVTKENVKCNIETVTEIFNIIRAVFGK